MSSAIVVSALLTIFVSACGTVAETPEGLLNRARIVLAQLDGEIAVTGLTEPVEVLVLVSPVTPTKGRFLTTLSSAIRRGSHAGGRPDEGARRGARAPLRAQTGGRTPRGRLPSPALSVAALSGRREGRVVMEFQTG